MRGPGTLGALLVLLLSLGIGSAVYARAAAPTGVLMWDEAAHNLWARVIFDDIARAQWMSLALDTYRQDFWPPLHPWYVSAFFAVLGPSTTAARLSSGVAFVGAGLAIYAGGRQFADRTSIRAAAVGGIAAAASFLMAGGAQTVASLSMTELLATFWIAVSFWLFARSTSVGHRPGAATHVGLGAAVFATYMARINFGVLIALAVFIEFLIDGEWLRRGRVSAALAERRRGHVLAALGLAVPLAIWFAYPPKIVKTLATLADFDPVGPARFSLDGLLFYPRALLWVAGSWPLLLLWLVALAVTLRVTSLRCDSRMRMIAILIGLQMFFAEMAVTKLERLILPLVPSFSVLVGVWAARLWHRLGEWSIPESNHARAFARGIFAFCSIPAVVLVTGSPPPLSAVTLGGPMQLPLAQYLIRDVRLHGPALIVATLDDAPTEIDWELVQSGVMGPDGAGSIASDSDIRFLDSGASRLPAFMPEVWRQQVNHYPGTSDTYTAYLGLPLGAADGLALDPANFNTRVQALLAHHPIERILLVQDPNGPTAEMHAEAGLTPLGYSPTPADASAPNPSFVELRRQ